MEENQQSTQDKKKKQTLESAADLERVTDYAEEMEIDLESNFCDVLANLQSSNRTAAANKEKELAKIKVSKEDIELIMHEMEVSKTCAEKALREANGNVVEALTVLVNS